MLKLDFIRFNDEKKTQKERDIFLDFIKGRKFALKWCMYSLSKFIRQNNVASSFQEGSIVVMQF